MCHLLWAHKYITLYIYNSVYMYSRYTGSIYPTKPHPKTAAMGCHDILREIIIR